MKCLLEIYESLDSFDDVCLHPFYYSSESQYLSHCCSLGMEAVLIHSQSEVDDTSDAVQDHAVINLRNDADERDPSVVVSLGQVPRFRHWNDVHEGP